MIIAVTGGREFDDRTMIDRNLQKWIRPYDHRSVIIHGAARGLDRLVGEWAFSHGVHAAPIPALWDTYGKRAGVYRNEAMLLITPELLLAFPGGIGTANAVAKARELNITVRFAE